MASRPAKAARTAGPTTARRAATRQDTPRQAVSRKVAGASTRHIVVGRISPAARAAGGLAVPAAAGIAVRPFLPLARTTDGGSLGRTAGALGLLGWLPAILLLAAAGYCCLRGVLPRLGLAVIGSAGALGIGVGLRSLWLLDTGRRSVLDLPVGGQALRGQGYQVGSGLILQLAVAAALVAALLCVLAGWTGTVMEDGGPFDRYRPGFGVAGLFLGAFAAVSFCVQSSDSPVGIAPATVTNETGLDRVGGLVLAVAVVVCCIVAATVRPWPASIGVYLGVFGILTGLAIENAIVVGRSPDLTVSLGTDARVVAAAVVLAVAVLAAFVRGRLPEGVPVPRRNRTAKNRDRKKARVGG